MYQKKEFVNLVGFSYPHIMIDFFTNLIHKFFILMYLFTYFERYYVHLPETNYPLVPCVLNSHLKTVTIPDAALIQFVLLKMSVIVFETCKYIYIFK